jgi:hypothetical protein
MDCHTHIEKCPFCRSNLNKHEDEYNDIINSIIRHVTSIRYREGMDRHYASMNVYHYVVAKTHLLKQDNFTQIREHIVRELTREFTRDILRYAEQLNYIFSNLL